MNFKDNIKQGGDDNFIKLKDKESVVGVFRGEPNEFYLKWENKKPILVEEGQGKFRFRINFVVKAGDTYVAKVFEGGVKIYNILKEMHEEYNLEETAIKITRNGEGLDTEYSLLPMKNGPSPETFTYMDHMDLADLNFEQKQEGSPSLKDEEPLPF